MKAVLFCFLAVAAVALAVPSDDKYTDKYDHINLEEILENKKLLEAYIKCILEQGKCTSEGRELKGHIKEGLENDCLKCTDAQRQGTDKVLKHLINKEHHFWDQLKAKYDPKGVYGKKYEDRLREVKA